eukprot:c30281_g1_i1 orf=83-265(+)
MKNRHIAKVVSALMTRRACLIIIGLKEVKIYIMNMTLTTTMHGVTKQCVLIFHCVDVTTV